MIFIQNNPKILDPSYNKMGLDFGIVLEENK